VKQNQKRCSRGQSLVETAIILPLVLLLIMGIIDFGLLFNNYILISNASREGARKAALGGTDAEVVETIQNITTSLDIANLSITITPDYASRGHGTEVRVSVSYKNKLITPIIDKFFPGGVAELNSASLMRVE
jgi:Flp pilus assembly protein TadG